MGIKKGEILMRLTLISTFLLVVFLTACGNDQDLSELTTKIDKANEEIERLKSENEKIKAEVSPDPDAPVSTVTTDAAAETAAQPNEEPVQEVYYKNCTAVRAAGAAPLNEGDPGYSTKLDRDRDGVACE